MVVARGQFAGRPIDCCRSEIYIHLRAGRLDKQLGRTWRAEQRGATTRRSMQFSVQFATRAALCAGCTLRAAHTLAQADTRTLAVWHCADSACQKYGYISTEHCTEI